MLLSLLFVPSVSVVKAETQKRYHTGVVVAWKGNVYVYREGRPKRIRVDENIPVQRKDIIVTEEASAVKILLADDTIVSMGEDGSLCVEELNLRDGHRRLFLRLVAGTLRVITGRHFTGKSYLKLDTTQASITVRGTDFIVNSMVDATEVVSLDGTVEVRNINGVGEGVYVEAGQMSRVTPDSPPDTPRETPPYYVEELLASTDVPLNLIAESRETDCRLCHREVYADASRYRHPELVLNCTRCHIKDTVKTSHIRFRDGWGDNLLFVDLEDGISYSITIRGVDSTGREATARFKVVPQDPVEEFPDDERPPVVSVPQVVEVKDGVFWSVTVVWRTDEPALSYIEYGRSDRFDHVARASTHYATEHRAVIERLQRGRTYHLRAVAEDAHRRRAYSRPVRVKIRRTLSTGENTTGLPRIEGLGLVRVGERLALRWKTSSVKEGTVLVGITDEGQTTGSSSPHFPGLNGIDRAGLYVCNECHRENIHLKASHPMVRIAGGLPAGLPLGTGGRMLCVTCHMSHGSQYPYVLRKEETELCVSCHER